MCVLLCYLLYKVLCNQLQSLIVFSLMLYLHALFCQYMCVLLRYNLLLATHFHSHLIFPISLLQSIEKLLHNTFVHDVRIADVFLSQVFIEFA